MLSPIQKYHRDKGFLSINLTELVRYVRAGMVWIKWINEMKWNEVEWNEVSKTKEI